MARANRRPGPLTEEEWIARPNQSPIGGQGSISYDGSQFRMQDALGIFDPRSGVGGGANVNWGIASFNTLGDDEHKIRLELGAHAQNIVFSPVIDVDNGANTPSRWEIVSFTVDVTGVDVDVFIKGDDFIHDSEDFTLEFEYLWR